MTPAELAALKANLAPTRGLVPTTRTYQVTGITTRAHEPGSPLVDFFGHASTIGQAYDMYGGPDKGGWDETVDKTAFNKTLSEDPDVAFLLNHTGMTMARTKAGTLSLSVDKTGLAVDAVLDTRVSTISDMVLMMEAKNLDEMSFAFRIIKDKWLTADGEEVPWWDLSGIHRHLTEVSLHKGDVSVVNYGANPNTDAGLRVSPDAFASALREIRTGATLSADTLTTLTAVMDSMGMSGEHMSAAQDTLSDLMGTADPDANADVTGCSGTYWDSLRLQLKAA